MHLNQEVVDLGQLLLLLRRHSGDDLRNLLLRHACTVGGGLCWPLAGACTSLQAGTVCAMIRHPCSSSPRNFDLLFDRPPTCIQKLHLHCHLTGGELLLSQHFVH